MEELVLEGGVGVQVVAVVGAEGDEEVVVAVDEGVGGEDGVGAGEGSGGRGGGEVAQG